MIDTRTVTAIILVAGNSTRYGQNRNKNFEEINGQAVLTYSLKAFSENNYVDNLEWCDCLYNIRYGTGIERNLKPRRMKIEQLTKDGQHVAYHLGVRELCETTGMNRRNIQRCLHNKPRFKSAYGYRWRFVDN